MASNSEKAVPDNGIQATDKREDVVSTGSLKIESVNGRAQILGATPEEILEAEEHARTMDLDETRKVRRTYIGRRYLFNTDPARRNSDLPP